MDRENDGVVGRFAGRVIKEDLARRIIFIMKVKALITLLSEMPADADVVAKGYEGGVDDIVNVKLVKLMRDVHDEWYYGRHDINEDGDVQAVFIQKEEREAADEENSE